MAKRFHPHRTVADRPQADRHINPLPHEVDALIAEAQVDADLRKKVLKGEDQPADMQHAESRRAGDPDRTGLSAARAAHLIAGLLDQTQDLDASGVIAAAFVGHHDAPGRPAQQRHAHGLLKLAQVACYGRLTYSEFARDCTETPTLRHAGEGAHALQGDVGFIHYLA